MFEIEVDKYRLYVEDGSLPEMHNEYIKHAKLVERYKLSETEGAFAFLAIGRRKNWPFLVVLQRYSPAGSGFHPGALIIPETEILLIGAGERLLAYELSELKKLWQEEVYLGFWGWERYEDVVFMLSELEFTAYDINANKLWSCSVEPPWTYKIREETVHVNMDERKLSFNLKQGPR